MDILNAREKRSYLINKLLEKRECVIALRCNYPGPDKDTPICFKIVSIFEKLLDGNFVKEKILNEGEGRVILYSGKNSKRIKQKMIKVENSHFLGRLVDIDVHDKTGLLSRKEFGFNSRTCYLCDDMAHNCIRTQKHSLDEIINFIEKK